MPAIGIAVLRIGQECLAARQCQAAADDRPQARLPDTDGVVALGSRS